MAWTNIFDLGEWDVYVRYDGVTNSPTPDNTAGWVLASELDPTVGTVGVVDGVIVCDLEDGAGAGGIQPSIVVFPSGTAPAAATARVSVMNEGIPDIATPEGTTFSEVISVDDEGGGVYGIDDTDLVDIDSGTPVTNIETSSEVESGRGLSYLTVRGGV